MRAPTLPHRSAARSALLGLGIVLACSVSTPAMACDRCPPHRTPRDSASIDTATLLRDLDQRAAAAASATPRLAFPARIGIARIEDGTVTPIPADEWSQWQVLRDQMSLVIGEMTPVAAIVAQSLTTSQVSSTPHNAITNLRLAAARQQLDAILLYEVSTTHSMERTEGTLLDITIIGAWCFPTHRSHATAHASATLIDVRSGHAYGSAIGNATDACSATLLGSEEKLHRQRASTVRKSVAALTPEVAGLMTRLTQSPPRNYARSAAPEPAAPAYPTGADRIIPPPTEGGESFWGPR